jgi:hypothetical protein
MQKSRVLGISGLRRSMIDGDLWPKGDGSNYLLAIYTAATILPSTSP